MDPLDYMAASEPTIPSGHIPKMALLTTSFPKFTHLPAELQHQIWRHAVNDAKQCIAAPRFKYYFIPSTALLVNEALLEVFHPALPPGLEAIHIHATKGPWIITVEGAAETIETIYLRPDIDILYFTRPTGQDLNAIINDPTNKKNIKLLGLCYWAFSSYIKSDKMVELLRNLEKLETVYIVAQNKMDQGEKIKEGTFQKDFDEAFGKARLEGRHPVPPKLEIVIFHQADVCQKGMHDIYYTLEK